MKLVLENKEIIKTIISILLFIGLMSSISAQDYIALQGSAAGSGRGIGSTSGQGNITVEIWSAPTDGSLLYNSSSDFWGALNNSRYDILLGNGSQLLSLNFSNTYYMELYINERELDFNGSERQVFQSPVGNITVTTPIKTTNNLNVNDFFNVTAATSAVQTNGSITIETRVVPAFSINAGFNVSGAGGVLTTNSTIAIDTLRPNAFTVNRGFNITGTDNAVRTNGTIISTNTDNDDALNITKGGMVIAPGGNALTIDNAGKVTVRTNDADDALNVTSGMVVGSGPGGNDQFKIDNNGAVRIQNPDTDDALNVTRGALVVAPGATAFRVGNDGKVTIQSTDTDDALNITGGLKMGSQIGSTFTFASFTISDQGIVTTDATIGPVAGRGHVIINSLTEPALRINSGFNVSGTSGALKTNGTITIVTASNNIPTQDDAFNVSGGGASFGDSIDFMRFALDPNLPLFTLKHILNVSAAGDVKIGAGANGKLTVVSTDTDDAFNVSTGAAFFGGSVNISGQIAITNADADDTLNLTKGGLTVSGAVVKVGDASSTTQHHVDVYDGGTNKCGYIRMFDDTGADWFLFANSTGQLRMFSDAPTGAGQCNTGGNGVGGQPN